MNAYDVAYEEARSAVGAGDLLRDATNFASIPEAVADATIVAGTTSGDHRELAIPLLPLPALRTQLPPPPERIAILFGSEKSGLSNDDLSYCHWLLRIPSRPEHGSMNLGQAVAVVLYELIRSESPAAAPIARVATQESLVRLEEYLLDSLRESGYQMSEATLWKLRRMIRRLEIPAKDSVMWQGMFRQILWKLRRIASESPESS